MMKRLNPVFVMILLTTVLGCGRKEPLPTVDKVDLEKYQGKWYEIARFPNRFEKGLDCTTANYTLKDNGKVKVVNKGRKTKSGKLSEAKGNVWVPDQSKPGELKVSFFWPFAGDYYIMALDENYQFVLVGSPSREYLWILARNKTLDDSIYKKLTETARKNGFKVEKLKRINQDCN